MSSFAALMEMSKAKTEANNAEVQTAIQRREENKRAAREAAERQEKQERERQEKLRQAQAEQERRQKEKERLRELAAKEKAREAERKQQEQMQKILGKSRHQAFENRDKEAGSSRTRKKKNSDEDGEGDGYSGSTLTRAEKRALKMDPDARPAWAQKLVGGSGTNGRASSSTPPSHSPGKARRPTQHQVNFTKVLDAPSALAAQGDQTLRIKERLKQSDYFVPIKLATVKRDKRTQADYFQEKRQRALVEKGDSYADWLTKPNLEGGSGSDSKVKPSTSNASPAARLTSASTSSVNRVPPLASFSYSDSPVGARKRRRSESLSSSDLDSDYSRKRLKPRSALSSQIWQMVTGKDRSQYTDDVFSDEDDDMEVSMAEVAREEARALVILLVTSPSQS
jgi:protein SPT2